MILLIRSEQLRVLADETRKALGMESCGIMLGILGDAAAEVEEIVPARNRLKSESEFEIDPEDLLRAIERGESESRDLVGFYHSHPSSSLPSPVDEEHMVLWPRKVWVMVSRSSLVLRAYRVISGEIEEVDIQISRGRLEKAGPLSDRTAPPPSSSPGASRPARASVGPRTRRW